MSAPDPLTCMEVFRRLDAYLDRTLSPEEVARVEAHLEECAACASEYRFETSLLDGIRDKLRRIELPGDLARRLEERLAAAAGPEDGKAGNGPGALQE